MIARGFFLLLLASVISAANPLKIDPKTEALARKLAGVFEKARTAEVEMSVTVKEKEGDVVIEYFLAVEKPNRLALSLKRETEGASLFMDGTNVIGYAPGLKIYTQGRAPKDLSGLAGGTDLDDGSGSVAFISALFSPKPYEALLAGVLEGTLAGSEKLNGEEFQKLKFKQKGLEWSLWMNDGVAASLRRIEVDLSKLDMNAAALVIDFVGWKFDQPIGRERFQLKVPEDAKRIDKLEDKEGEDSDLVGEAAPTFKLKGIDGKEWNSNAWKGAPSILFFWAGQEEHCVQALLAVSQLAAMDKKLKVLAINSEEKPDAGKVREFVKKHKLTAPVAIDANGEMGEKFEIVGVPTTFLMDADGVIRKAYLGYHAEFRQILEKELQALRK